jgi:DNA-binding XRE family transcriptional regulator
MSTTEANGDCRNTAAPGPQLDNDLFDELTAKKGAITDQERADLIGVPRSQLYRYRAGRFSPQLALAMHMAQVLGTSVERLFGGGKP